MGKKIVNAVFENCWNNLTCFCFSSFCGCSMLLLWICNPCFLKDLVINFGQKFQYSTMLFEVKSQEYLLDNC